VSIEIIARWTGFAAGVWLAGLGVWMAAAPRQALAALAAMGGSPRVHFGEMGVRTAVGGALMLAAPVSRFPAAVMIMGGFLVVSAIVLMLLPRRWHAAYSTWWAARIPVAAVRVIAPLSVVAGGMLIWVLARPSPT
jgi:uncharacterized protein YjeT (DUF2065 family)